MSDDREGMQAVLCVRDMRACAYITCGCGGSTEKDH
jgi:hypothetical protein